MGLYFFPVENSHPVYIQKRMPTNSVLSNCWLYVKSRFPSLPPTKTILANLSDKGEVGVLYYPSSNLYHYVVVEDFGETVTFSETNFAGHKKTIRELPRTAFVGFYDIF